MEIKASNDANDLFVSKIEQLLQETVNNDKILYKKCGRALRRNLFDDFAVLFFRFIGDYFRVRAGKVSNSIQKKQNNIVAIVNRFL